MRTHGHTLHLSPCLLSTAPPPVVLCLSCHTHTHTHTPLATVRRCTPLWMLCSTLSVSRDAFRHLSVCVWQVILRFPSSGKKMGSFQHVHIQQSLGQVGNGELRAKYVKLAVHTHGTSCISRCYGESWEIIGYNWDPFRCFLSVCRFVLPSTTKAVAAALHHGRVDTYLSLKLSNSHRQDKEPKPTRERQTELERAENDVGKRLLNLWHLSELFSSALLSILDVDSMLNKELEPGDSSLSSNVFMSAL